MVSVRVRILSVYGRSRYLYIVLGGYMRILGDPVFNPVSPYGYLLPTVYLYIVNCLSQNSYIYILMYAHEKVVLLIILVGLLVVVYSFLFS